MRPTGGGSGRRVQRGQHEMTCIGGGECGMNDAVAHFSPLHNDIGSWRMT